MYEWIKALHVVAVIAWMAGLLYLPRLFVYHTQAAAGSNTSETFKVMERRLLKAIMNPAMIVTWLAGLWIVETFLLEPKMFHGYIALDPSLWWNKAELVTSASSRLQNLKGIKRTLFLSSAVDQDIVANTANLAERLKKARIDGLTSYYEPRPDLTHMTIFRGEGPKAFVTVLK